MDGLILMAFLGKLTSLVLLLLLHPDRITLLACRDVSLYFMHALNAKEKENAIVRFSESFFSVVTCITIRIVSWVIYLKFISNFFLTTMYIPIRERFL
jgi:hypothetical protein